MLILKKWGGALFGISGDNGITKKRTGTLGSERTLQTLCIFYFSFLSMDKLAIAEPLCPHIENGDTTSYFKGCWRS